MSEENTQPVAIEPNATAQPVAEVPSARTDDDLDTLLKEFDTETTRSPEPAQPAPAAPAANDTAVANETVLSEAKFIRQQRFQKDMDDTIKKVRGDLPEELFDGPLVQAWINARAEKDERLANAWANRHADPKKFEQVVGALGKQFSKYGKLPDKNATEDREAVSAAVRGASHQAPGGKAPDFSRMTDAEFAAEKEKAFGR